MKQKLFNLTGIIIMIVLTLNGCKKDDPQPDPVVPVVSVGKQILSFKIVTPATTAVIDTTAKTITLSVPVGTTLTSLNTDISLADGYTISPAAGVAKDFTNPVVYTVTRGTTTTNWTVTVKINYPLVSPGKQLLSFKFVTPAVTGTIDSVAKTISLPVPTGTAVTSLVTDISVASGYSISPASGVATNFTNPVSYTVSRTGQTSVVWTVSAASPVVNVTTDITSSVTWTANKTYILTGDIEVLNSSVLTIEAGTVIKFNAGASLSIGYSSNATLIANGTAASPITFTSSAVLPAAGAWEGLFFYSNTLSNTSLSYCNIQYAGSNTQYGAINITSCDIAINNCTISNSNSYGIKTYYSNSKGGFVTFTNNTISSSANYGIVLNAQKLSFIGTGNTFTNVIGVLIEGDFNSNTAQTWRKLSVPYIVDQELDIDGNLTIEAGTTFKFTSNGWMSVGYYASTTFIADGTASAPITFTSTATSPVAGAWRSVAFYGLTQTNSRMSYCIIDYAGSNATFGALDMNSTSSITFTNNTIRNSASFGINMEWDAGFQVFTNNTINTCADHLVVINTKHLGELGSGNALTAASQKGILISGDYTYPNPVTWKKQTADFYVTGGELAMDGDITIEAGSKFLFVNDSYFYFGYYANTKITAVGTSTNPITFTTSASSPAAGAWRGVYFDSNTQTNSALTYCVFQYTGRLAHPAIYTKISFPVNNTSITNFSSTHAAEYKTGITVPSGTGNDFSWFAN